MNLRRSVHTSNKQLKNRLRDDIGQKLVLAFGAIIVLTLVISLLTLYSFNHFSRVVNSITIQTIPLVVSAGKLSERSQSLAISAPNLSLARNSSELQAITLSLDIELKTINDSLDALSGYLDQNTLKAIRAEVALLSEIFSRLERLSETRLRLRQSREEIIVTLERIRANFADASTPISYGIRSLMNLFANRAGRRSDRMIQQLMQNDEARTASLAQFRYRDVAKEIRTANIDLVNQAVKESTAAAEFRGLGNDLLNLLNTVLLLNSKGSILQSETRFNRTLNELIEVQKVFAEGALAERNPILVDNMSKIERDIESLRKGISNPFELRSKELKLARETDDYLEHGREVSARLSEMIGHVVSAVMKDVHSLQRDTETLTLINVSVIIAGSLFLLMMIIVIAKNTAKTLRQYAMELRTSKDRLEQDVITRTSELVEAKKEAERANQAKSRFLAAASHDLRQPLQAITMNIYSLKHWLQGSVPAIPTYDEYHQKGVVFTNNLEKSTSSLTMQLDGILDISKLEAGVIQPEFGYFYVAEMIESIQREFLPLAEQKHIELQFIDEINGCQMESDPHLFRRILQNLIINAIKYTNKGFIRIALTQPSSDEIVIAIEDSGIGIPEDQMDEIFDEFFQVENSERDAAKGLGLGLASVKHLCRLLNVRIRVESKEGLGSTFYLHINEAEVSFFQVVPENVSKEPDMTSCSLELIHAESVFLGAKILVVDDDKAVAESLAQVMSVWKCEVSVFHSHHSALQCPKRFDALILDYKLPDGKTGLEVADDLNQQAPIPTLIVTGTTNPAQLKMIKDSGYLFCRKPVHPDMLKSFLARHCG